MKEMLMCSHPHNAHTVKKRKKEEINPIKKRIYRMWPVNICSKCIGMYIFYALKHSSIVSHCFMIKKSFTLYGKCWQLELRHIMLGNYLNKFIAHIIFRAYFWCDKKNKKIMQNFPTCVRIKFILISSTSQMYTNHLIIAKIFWDLRGIEKIILASSQKKRDSKKKIKFPRKN